MRQPASILTFKLIVVLLISACSTSPAVQVSTSTPTKAPEEPHVFVSEIELTWPALASAEQCSPADAQSEVKFCVLNDGTEVGPVPESVYLMLPAAAAPATVWTAFNSLPGGPWGTPKPLIVSRLPGIEGDLQALLLPQLTDETDGEPVNVVFACVPTSQGCGQGLVVFHSPKSDSQSQAVWIGPPDMTGHSQIMGILLQDKPGEDGSKGIIVVDSMPAEGEQGIIVVDSMPAEGEQGIIVVDSIPAEGEQGIIIINTMPVGNWSARAIIIVNTMPGPGESTEGIIVVDSMPGDANLFHVMGIIMENKHGEDGSEGIIIVNNMPASGEEGIIIVNNMPAGGEEGIIIINNMPAVDDTTGGHSGFKLPYGFDPQGMTAMMGEGGFGPGPKILMKVYLSELGVPELLAPGEEVCVFPQVQLVSGGGGDFFIDSFFDVFVDLTASIPSTEESSGFEIRRFPAPTPPYAFCTPTPTPTLVTLPPTSTPIPRQVIPPTPTTRTGLPTNTPVSRLPTTPPNRR